MTRLQGLDPFYVKALDEHRELNCLVGEIEHKLTSRLIGEWPDWTELPQLFKILLIHLEQHFKEEEAGGLLEEVVCRLPRLGPQATALERQHEPLLKQLRPIVEKAQTCGCSPDQWAPIAREFRGFLQALMVHEAAENHLAEEAFNVEGDSMACGNDTHCADPLTPGLGGREPSSERDQNSPQNEAQGSTCCESHTPASNVQYKKEDH